MMKPPMAGTESVEAPRPDMPAAVLSCPPHGDTVIGSLSVLRHRGDFVRASHGLRHAAPGFHLQARARDRDAENPAGIRVGFTCSRKVGNSVARNRAKRRLREIARLTLPQHGHDGWDYVLVGRAGATAEADFTALLKDLRRALDRVHRIGS